MNNYYKRYKIWTTTLVKWYAMLAFKMLLLPFIYGIRVLLLLLRMFTQRNDDAPSTHSLHPLTVTRRHMLKSMKIISVKSLWKRILQLINRIIQFTAYLNIEFINPIDMLMHFSWVCHTFHIRHTVSNLIWNNAN